MVALENGKLDQQVTLLNPESNQEVRALVTGIGRASSF
jgi:flagella basal body P-ring formation protein FlgA